MLVQVSNEWMTRLSAQLLSRGRVTSGLGCHAETSPNRCNQRAPGAVLRYLMSADLTANLAGR
jgi:hypothetical protein